MPTTGNLMKKHLRWKELWFRDNSSLHSPRFPQHYKHGPFPIPVEINTVNLSPKNPKDNTTLSSPGPDLTSSLSDEVLLQVLLHLPDSSLTTISCVCKRWLRLTGRLRRRIRVFNWSLVQQLPSRFPDLSDVDLVPASFVSASHSSGVLLSRAGLSLQLPMDSSISECQLVSEESLNEGLGILANAFPGITRLSVVTTASEEALLSIAEKCSTLQELELHKCTDSSLRPISAFGNLQVLRLVGCVEGVYGGAGVTDIGLTILAHGCKRLVKLELCGCEGSYDGISAIGRCCFMLEELTISNHRMDGGWMVGLSYCGNLKTLKLQGCRRIDIDPGPDDYLGSCPTIERIHFQKCQLRDKRSLSALLRICNGVRDVVFHDCWGLDNEMFSVAGACRKVKILSLKGCSQLTTEGLESVVLSWKDLQHLSVISCNNVKDSEVSAAMSSLFALLKELKWRPDSRSILAASLKGTGMWRKGGKFFKKA